MKILHNDYETSGNFVLMDGEKQIGDITYLHHEQSYLDVNHTFVDPDYTGQGLALQLLDAVIAYAQEKSFLIKATCPYVKHKMLIQGYHIEQLYVTSNQSKTRVFLNMVATGNIDNAFERFVAEDFVHHNPYFKSDRFSLLEAMKESEEVTPNKTYTILHLTEGDDIVMSHAKIELGSGQADIVAAHILRFRDGWIVEMWDVSMVVPEDSPNELK